MLRWTRSPPPFLEKHLGLEPQGPPSHRFKGAGRAGAHLPLVVLAVDLHEVLLHLHREVLRREVLHVQEDDEFVPVRPDLKPNRRSCGSAWGRGSGREGAPVPARQARGPLGSGRWLRPSYQNRNCRSELQLS